MKSLMSTFPSGLIPEPKYGEGVCNPFHNLSSFLEHRKGASNPFSIFTPKEKPTLGVLGIFLRISCNEFRGLLLKWVWTQCPTTLQWKTKQSNTRTLGSLSQCCLITVSESSAQPWISSSPALDRVMVSPPVIRWSITWIPFFFHDFF
jgi:hypothetical protein